MPFCYVCGSYYEEGREMTCSQPCHDKLVTALMAKFGKFKKIVRASTGGAFKVPTIDIIEKGVREQDLEQYPRWERDK